VQPISETRAVIMSVRCQDRGHGRPGAGIGEQSMPFDATGFRDEGAASLRSGTCHRVCWWLCPCGWQSCGSCWRCS